MLNTICQIVGRISVDEQDNLIFLQFPIFLVELLFSKLSFLGTIMTETI